MYEWEADINGFGPCSLVGFTVIGVETLGSTATEVVK
jgi:hypothetical protein